MGRSSSDEGTAEHLFLSELLECGLTYDCLNLPNLSIYESIARRYMLWEEVYREMLQTVQARTGTTQMLEQDERAIFMSAKSAHALALVSPKLEEFVAGELRDRASVLKERRKAREEREARVTRGGNERQWNPKKQGGKKGGKKEGE